MFIWSTNQRREIPQLSELKAGSPRVANTAETICADRHDLLPATGYFATLFCSGNRLNHHHLSHDAALYRRPLTSELVQFSLVPIQRVNLLPYDQRVLRAFLYAVSGALSRALALFHVVSATHGVADSSG